MSQSALTHSQMCECPTEEEGKKSQYSREREKTPKVMTNEIFGQFVLHKLGRNLVLGI